MADSSMGWIVGLDHDIPKDRAQDIARLLLQIRGVLSVDPIPGGSIADSISYRRAKRDVRDRMEAVFEDLE